MKRRHYHFDVLSHLLETKYQHESDNDQHYEKKCKMTPASCCPERMDLITVSNNITPQRTSEYEEQCVQQLPGHFEEMKG